MYFYHFRGSHSSMAPVTSEYQPAKGPDWNSGSGGLHSETWDRLQPYTPDNNTVNHRARTAFWKDDFGKSRSEAVNFRSLIRFADLLDGTDDHAQKLPPPLYGQVPGTYSSATRPLLFHALHAKPLSTNKLVHATSRAELSVDAAGFQKRRLEPSSASYHSFKLSAAIS